MTYPHSAGFQKNSETSREAAELLTSRGDLQNTILSKITAAGEVGLTVDEALAEISEEQNKHFERTTIGARFTELEKSGVIALRDWTRVNPKSGRMVGVYTLRRAPPPVAVESAFDQWKAKEARSGHGYVVQRKDGIKARCGGPGICKVCKMAKSYLEAMEGKS